MSQKFKLTIAWALLIIATILSLFISQVDKNGIFVSILAFKKFMLIGYIYLEAMEAHFIYKLIIFFGGSSLLIANLIWHRFVC